MSSKADMMSRYRLDGMEFALKIAKEKGVEGLEEELRFRNRNGLGIPVSQEELDRATEQIKEVVYSTVMIMWLLTIRDELGFGQKRLNRLLKRFDSKTDCLAKGFCTWQDMADVMREETGLKLDLIDGTKNMVVKIQDGKKR